VWFIVLAVLGVTWIVQRPQVLVAVNPYYAFEFFRNNGWRGFLVLGSVFLVVTGGEALYADMGHFGRSADPAGVVMPGAAGAAAQLLRAGALLLRRGSGSRTLL
jgi:K+ transporter